jgi:hypothetical protein
MHVVLSHEVIWIDLHVMKLHLLLRTTRIHVCNLTVHASLVQFSLLIGSVIYSWGVWMHLGLFSGASLDSTMFSILCV